jgi:hypothetical protein
MSDNVNIIVQDTINEIVVNSAVIVETIDINVQAQVDEVTIITNPNNYIVNINRVIGQQVQSDWNQTQQRIIQLVQNTPAFIDSTGVGDPIVEQIQRACSRAQGFKFTSQSKQQLIEGLVLAVQRTEIRFPEDPIGYEMESFEYEYTRTGVRYSAPSGLHDDCVCSLALALDCKSKNRPGLFYFA